MQSQTVPIVDTAGRALGRRAVKAAIAIVGLLIISGIVSALPMVRNSPPIFHRSWLDMISSSGQPGVFAPSGGTTASFEQALQRWAALIASDPQLLTAPSSTASYRASIRAVLEGQRGSLAAEVLRGVMSSAHWAIFPLDVVHAAIATLIFIVLFAFGLDLRRAIEDSPQFADLGEAAEMGVLVIIAALAFGAYQNVAFPLLGGALRSLYGWVFLAAGLIPLCWGAVLASRDLDTVTATMFQPRAPRLPRARCVACGSVVQPGARFCPRCGASPQAPAAAFSGAQAPQPARCQQCGTELKPGARFCGRCGRPNG